METTERLAMRVEALASALRASGADPEAVSRLLAGAATAALDALTLDLLHQPVEPAAAPAPPVVSEPAEPELPGEAEVPLAA